jgi:hypothetical protein
MLPYKKFFFIINGFIIILFILWNYLIRVRLPKDITSSIPSNYILFYYILMFLTFMYLTLKIIIEFYVGSPQHLKIIKYLNEVKENSLLEADNFIRNKIENLLAFQQKLFLYFYEHLLFVQYVYVFFMLVPKIIVVSLFLVDVLYLNMINYFYKALPLLLLPLITRYIIFDFQRLYDKQCTLISECINIHSYDTGDEIYAELISLKYYIEQTLEIRQLGLDKNFDCLITIDSTYIQHVLNMYDGDKTEIEFDYKSALTKFNYRIELLIKLKTVLWSLQKYRNLLEIKLNLLLYLTYTFCWGFIIYTILPDSLTIIYFCPENPFSGTYF